jgi:1,4-alpha-glucan branching enzyme
MTDPVTLTEYDRYLFNEGSHRHLYRHLGAHARENGTHFGIWAPSAEGVSVIGRFNDWNREATPLRPQGESGIWTGFVEGARKGDLYKYFIRGARGHRVEKADPVGFRQETPPRTGSVVVNG